jgi:AraC-like DNA-binding protein
MTTMLCRRPSAVLRPFVELIWATDRAGQAPPVAARELVLPTGAMHVVLRLGGEPLRIFADADDRDGHAVGSSLLGGVLAAPYCKSIADPAPTVGAMLRPGAVELLSCAPARVLAGAHSRLEDLWQRADLAELRERLEAAADGERRLAVLETFLVRRLPRVRGVHPLVAHVLARLRTGADVAVVVEETGYSHRHLAHSFEEAVGMTPKTYGRVQRFGRVLDRLNASPGVSLADIAAAESYADQAHMSRDFKAFAGVTPGRYRRIAPASPRHVPN